MIIIRSSGTTLFRNERLFHLFFFRWRLICKILLFCEQMHQFGYQCRPAGLMAGAQSCAAFAMKIFIEQNEVSVLRTLIEPAVCPMRWAFAMLVWLKQGDQPAGKLLGHLYQVHFIS